MKEQAKQKIEEINANKPAILLAEVENIIFNLRKHLSNEKVLTQSKIEQLCKRLTCFTTLPSFELKAGHWVGRARKIKAEQEYVFNTKDLSYVPENKLECISIGRMNREKESLFYCSYGGKITPDKMMDTIFAEVNAKENERYYMLASSITQPINCAVIGLFDYYRRKEEHPFVKDKSLEELYAYYKSHTHRCGMKALELSDEFLIEVLTAKNDVNNRVYEITSEISNDCFNANIDGILYPSVKLNGYPNLVLKTNIVDSNLKHQFVYDYGIKKDLRSGYYEFEEKNIASVFPHPSYGYISWPDERINLAGDVFMTISNGNDFKKFLEKE